MKEKHIPMRRCIVCRESKPKKELIRIIDKNTSIHIDKSGNMKGRGAYICKSRNCFETIQNKGVLKRALRRNIDEEALSGFFKELQNYESENS